MIGEMATGGTRARDGPIFVVGCPRSGTTVLGTCLAAHAELGGGDESSFLTALAHVYESLYMGRNPRQWAPLSKYLSEESMIAVTRRYADAILFSRLSRENKKRLVDHTPWYVKIIPFITLLYPSATVIHIIRDGRQVARSLMKSYQDGYSWAGHDIASCAKLWSECVRSGQEAGRKMNHESYREVRYEQLCENPLGVLSDLVEWLGLEMEEAVLSPLTVRHATPARTNATLASNSPSGQLLLHPIRCSRTWPPSWTTEERAAFSMSAGAVLQELGYDA